MTPPAIIEETILPDGLVRYVIGWPGHRNNITQTTTKTREQVLNDIGKQFAREVTFVDKCKNQIEWLRGRHQKQREKKQCQNISNG